RAPSPSRRPGPSPAADGPARSSFVAKQQSRAGAAIASPARLFSTTNDERTTTNDKERFSLAWRRDCVTIAPRTSILQTSRAIGRKRVMGFKLDRVHVWSGEVTDQAGGVAAKLALLAQAGANLEYIYTRRKADKPGYGVIYVAPISGPLQVR